MAGVVRFTSYSLAAKKTFLSTFEYNMEDENEPLDPIISNSWNKDTNNLPTTPKTSQGRLANLILNKNKVKVFFAPLTCLQSFNCVLPPQTDISKSKKTQRIKGSGKVS